MVFDAHAQSVDKYGDQNGFLKTGAVNEAAHC